MLKRKTPMKRTSHIKRGGRLRSQSKKRRREGRDYSERRAKFLDAHLLCQVRTPVCFGIAQDVHHVSGRLGSNYLDETTWLAVCRHCHDWIHQHPSEARARGWLK